MSQKTSLEKHIKTINQKAKLIDEVSLELTKLKQTLGSQILDTKAKIKTEKL